MMLKPSQETVDAGFSDDPKPVDTETGWPQPSAYIQWKGTDLCMDFHCECGAFCHLDSAFAYTVQCPKCQTIWEMPCVIYPRKADDRTYQYWRDNPKPLEMSPCDEDE